MSESEWVGDTGQEESSIKRVHVVSLGCPKNRVDSEVMLGHLAFDGYAVTQNPEEADVLLVNTCAFIDAAKEESVDAILEMAEAKKAASARGKDTKLLVAGCLSQRYAPDLADEIPEVDGFLGTGNFQHINTLLQSDGGRTTPKSLPIIGQAAADVRPVHPRLTGPNKLEPFAHQTETIHIPDPDFDLRADAPRLNSLPPYMSYLKVSEGCSNTCAFCIIPKLRGPQRSRPIADILLEAEKLLDRGVVELNLIAQDLCAYGTDRKPRESLADLLEALDDLAVQASHPVWIRCLYAYPKGLSTRVMEAIADRPTIVPYLDMPLQHISDALLRSMSRGAGGESTKKLLRTLRQKIPTLTLRTTFITGLPGETEEDFEGLLDLVSEIRFQHMGVFAYSPEEDTPAATMDNQVPIELAEERKERLLALQRDISADHQADLVGKTVRVLVEGVSDESELLLQGRHEGQAPDIDGLTYISEGSPNIGEVVQVSIDEAGDYDVAGRMI